MDPCLLFLMNNLMSSFDYVDPSITVQLEFYYRTLSYPEIYIYSFFLISLFYFYFFIFYYFLFLRTSLSFIFIQPMSMVLPGVVGFKLLGKLRDGVTATDLVLTVTQMLRKHGVVGKFVEFYGKPVCLIMLSSCTGVSMIDAPAGAWFPFLLTSDIGLCFLLQGKA